MTFLEFLQSLDLSVDLTDSISLIESAKTELLNQLKNLFENPILQLDYTSQKNWHLGIKPASLAHLSADEGRDVVLAIVEKYLPNLIIGQVSSAHLSIHRQKLPSFVPKERDKGIHITIGMNDTYLEDQGKKPINFDKLKDDAPESLKSPKTLESNPFEIQGFGFLNGNEGNMDMCNGRTGFVAFLNKSSSEIVTNLRAEYQTTDSKRHPHITLSYLSFKTNDGEWNHDLWNNSFCPMGTQENLNAFYLNPKFKTHNPLPCLILGLFKAIKTEEQAITLKSFLTTEN